jgi:hypothetical protein
VNSRTLKSQTFSQLSNTGPEFPDIFPDTPGNPRIRENVRIFRPVMGESNSTEIKLAQM